MTARASPRAIAETVQPEQFADRFSDAIRKLVARKAAAGEAKAVEPLEAAPAGPSNVIDLSELLRSSLQTRKRPASGAAKRTRKAAVPSRAGAKLAARRA